MKEKYNSEIDNLQKKLDNSIEEIKHLKQESLDLKKAIWDMLNYTSMFVLLLDDKFNIKFMNWSLATELGFSDEKEAIGKSWLNLIPKDSLYSVQNAYKYLKSSNDEKHIESREMVTEVKRVDGSFLIVKWFNIPISTDYDITFSMGLRATTINSHIISEDSIRSYYRDIIEKDRTMIESLKDIVISR